MPEKVSNELMGLQVGDIVYGTRGYNCTTPRFYEVVGFAGKKSIKLQLLHPVYDTRYGPNSPLYFAIPEKCVERVGKTWFDVTCHYEENEKPFNSFVWKFERFAWETKDTYYLKEQGPYGSLLYPWDGMPVAGNCD